MRLLARYFFRKLPKDFTVCDHPLRNFPQARPCIADKPETDSIVNPWVFISIGVPSSREQPSPKSDLPVDRKPAHRCARIASVKRTLFAAVGSIFLGLVLCAQTGTDASHQSFHITPLKPVDELRREALQSQPPAEQGKRKSDLVEVIKLDPTIKLDIRYASDNNFMATPFYSEARAFLQRPAAQELVAANGELRERGYGILIHDAYRPWYVTKMFWDATPDDKKKFVADPAQGSRHNRGCAADVSLYDMKTGLEVAMPSGYDEMSERAYPNYSGGNADERARRDLLREVMEKHEFTVYQFEWWHFDYKDCTDWPIGNISFEKLNSSGQ